MDLQEKIELFSVAMGSDEGFISAEKLVTTEITPKLPTVLMRLSDIIVAEAPTGVKSSMAQ